MVFSMLQYPYNKIKNIFRHAYEGKTFWYERKYSAGGRKTFQVFLGEITKNYFIGHRLIFFLPKSAKKCLGSLFLP